MVQIIRCEPNKYKKEDTLVIDDILHKVWSINTDHRSFDIIYLIEKSPIIHSLQPRTSKTGKGGSGPLKREDNIAYTIDTGNTQAIEYKDRIRVLTPKECFRLMGFHNDEINLQGISKTTAYFSAGNGWDINLASKIFKGMLQN